MISRSRCLRMIARPEMEDDRRHGICLGARDGLDAALPDAVTMRQACDAEALRGARGRAGYRKMPIACAGLLVDNEAAASCADCVRTPGRTHHGARCAGPGLRLVHKAIWNCLDTRRLKAATSALPGKTNSQTPTNGCKITIHENQCLTAQRRLDRSPIPSATCPRESVLPIRLRPNFSFVIKGYAGAAEHWPRRQAARKRSLRANILRTS